MGTRCTINFSQGNKAVATIYRHWDGYPATVLEELGHFFTDVEGQCGQDTRFDDPSHLAAKFVVWQAMRYAREPGKPLLFTGVGVLDAGGTQSDLEWVYDLECSDRTARPVVTHRAFEG